MVSNQKTIIIAFDGTAASGKSTVAKLVAKKYGYDYLDTGLMFRKVAYCCTKQNTDFHDKQEVLKVINTINFSESIDKGEIYSDNISNLASQIATKGYIREELLKIQRKFANGKKGVVVDGRDIGTVVFPNADFKFFFDASLEERAIRRYSHLRNKGKDVVLSQVLESLRERDQRDRIREVAPLRQADGAFVINTTDSSINEVLDMVLKKINKKI